MPNPAKKSISPPFCYFMFGKTSVRTVQPVMPRCKKLFFFHSNLTSDGKMPERHDELCSHTHTHTPTHTHTHTHTHPHTLTPHTHPTQTHTITHSLKYKILKICQNLSEKYIETFYRMSEIYSMSKKCMF